MIRDWMWLRAFRRRAEPDAELVLALKYGGELMTARAALRDLEKAYNAESSRSMGLATDVTRLEKAQALASVKLGTANARIEQLETQLRTRPMGELTSCECGGDTELHWRRQAEQLRAQAARDRTNAVRLDNRLAQAEGRPVIRSLA